jgi:hypothetical protein
VPDQGGLTMLFGRLISVGSCVRSSLLLLLILFLTGCSEEEPYRITTLPDTTPPVITSGPHVALTQTRVTVTWRTDDLSHGNLQISGNGDFSSAIHYMSPSLSVDHSISVESDPNSYGGEEFTSGVTYTYRVRGTNQADLTSDWVTGTFKFQP